MKHNRTYHFVLVLSGVNQDTEGLEDALFEAGCDDALISYKNRVVCLDFDRESDSLENAIISSIHDVEGANIGAKAAHIEGAFVTLSEIAERTGFTKQAISLFIQGKRGPGGFPIPFTGVNSSSPIWRFRDVVVWLHANGKLDSNKLFDDKSYTELDIIDGINRALEERDENVGKQRDKILSILNNLKHVNTKDNNHQSYRN